MSPMRPMLAISAVLVAVGTSTMSEAVRALAWKCGTMTGTATLRLPALMLTKNVARQTEASTRRADRAGRARRAAAACPSLHARATDAVVRAGQGRAAGQLGQQVVELALLGGRDVRQEL